MYKEDGLKIKIINMLKDFYDSDEYKFTFIDYFEVEEFRRKHVLFEFITPEGIRLKANLIRDGQIGGRDGDKVHRFLIEDHAHLDNPEDVGWMHNSEADIIFIHDLKHSKLYGLNWKLCNMREHIISDYTPEEYPNKKDGGMTRSYFIPIEEAKKKKDNQKQPKKKKYNKHPNNK